MPPTKTPDANAPCPCGSSKTLASCCAPYLNGTAIPPTAEALMRSRYTAYVLGNIDYLWETWSADTRVRSSKQEIQDWASSCEWLGLRIITTEAGNPEDKQGLVSFIAIYRQGGKLQEHQETSLFTKTPNGWRYVDHQ